jgi:hypothetical protein
MTGTTESPESLLYAASGNARTPASGKELVLAVHPPLVPHRLLVSSRNMSSKPDAGRPPSGSREIKRFEKRPLGWPCLTTAPAVLSLRRSRSYAAWRVRGRGRAARPPRRPVRCGRWSGCGGGSGRCRRCRRVGIRTSLATRSTSSIGCFCMSTRISWSGIGSGLGWRGECECSGCYSRSPAASRASRSVEQLRHQTHLPSSQRLDTQNWSTTGASPCALWPRPQTRATVTSPRSRSSSTCAL